jgi:hypothetical protein
VADCEFSERSRTGMNLKGLFAEIRTPNSGFGQDEVLTWMFLAEIVDPRAKGFSGRDLLV